MKIDFNFPVLNLDGTQVNLPDGSPAFLNKLLANWIMNTATTKPTEITKYFNWATELFKTGSIDLDKVGKKEFQLFVENLEGVSVLVKGMIFEKLYLE